MFPGEDSNKSSLTGSSVWLFVLLRKVHIVNGFVCLFHIPGFGQYSPWLVNFSYFLLIFLILNSGMPEIIGEIIELTSKLSVSEICLPKTSNFGPSQGLAISSMQLQSKVAAIPGILNCIKYVWAVIVLLLGTKFFHCSLFWDK